MASDVFVAFMAGSVLAWGAGRVQRRVSAWLAGMRAKRAEAGTREQRLQWSEDAEALLKKSGYAIVARDAPSAYALSIDGDPQIVNVAADFLVEREGKRSVAEVRTGPSAKLTTPITRWLLLEHQHAFAVGSVLLVDPVAGTLATVRFPLAKTALSAVPPPLPQKREASARAKEQQQRAASLARRRRMLKLALASATAGLVWWMLRGDPEAPPTAEPLTPTPALTPTEARVPRKKK